MSTPPITVTIAGDDAQLNAILSRALANIKTFGSQAGTSGEAMKRSFGEARGSVALLNEELGVGLSKHLRTILATSELIGPALELAFPIIAAVGFFEVIDKIAHKLADFYYDADGIKQLGEDIKTTTEYLVKLSAEVDHLNQQTSEVGVSAQQKWATALDDATKKLATQNETTRRLSDTIYALQNGQQNAFGSTGSINGNTAEDLPHLKDLYAEATSDAAKFYAEQQHAQAELNAAQRQGVDEYSKALTEAEKKLDSFLFRIRQEKTKVEPSTSKVAGNHIDTFTDLLAIQEQPNQAIADKYLAHFKALQAVYDETRTPAELLAISIKNLNDLFGGDTSSVTYLRAVANIKDKYDETRHAVEKFGQAAGQALEQGILMGRSWEDILESLIVSVAQLIVKMYVLKALQASSFGSSGFGSFLTALVSGFAGKAGGGDVSGGTPYMVGENGPELFMPNTSGTIVPNGKWGGGHTVYNDFRGAVVTDDLLRKSDAATIMSVTQQRAVAQAVGIVRENGLRGRI